ncbi:hypothetical protein [Azotosporobacter soli]|uniref:hypothetical protein n=1 Tax=Azotosporobacter soli TaxID=3055040 RepID=UPI0031FEC42B
MTGRHTLAERHGRRFPPGIPFTAACRAHVCPQRRSALKKPRRRKGLSKTNTTPLSN